MTPSPLAGQRGRRGLGASDSCWSSHSRSAFSTTYESERSSSSAHLLARSKTSGSMVKLTDFLGASDFRPMMAADSTFADTILHQPLQTTLDDTIVHDIIVSVNTGNGQGAALASCPTRNRPTRSIGWSSRGTGKENQMPLSSTNPVTCDRVLRSAVRLGLVSAASETTLKNCTPSYDGIYEIGRFAFGTNAHSTGCSVRVWALGSEGESFQIINTTYWYSPTYLHNKDIFVTGAAMDAFNKTLADLLVKIDAADAAQRAVEAAQQAQREAEEQSRIDACNASFSTPSDEPTPDKMYKWILEIEVSETLVADGFRLTDQKWRDWARDGVQFSEASEVRTKVLYSPSPESISKAQGFGSVEEFEAANK